MSDLNPTSPAPVQSAYEKLIQASKKVIYEGRNGARSHSQNLTPGMMSHSVAAANAI